MQGGPQEGQDPTPQAAQWTQEPPTAPSGPTGPAGVGAPPGAAESKPPGIALAAMIVGIGALCLAILFNLVGVIAGIVAVILAVLAKKEYDQNPGLPGKGMVTAGLVLGIIAIVLGIVLFLVFLLVVDWDALIEDMENAVTLAWTITR